MHDRQSVKSPGRAADVTRGVIRWGFKSVVFTVVFAACLFIASGDRGWGMAWVYLGVYLVNQIILALVLSPELLAERSGAQEGTKPWDLPLAIVAVIVLPLAMDVVAGLDHRHGWTASLSPGLQVAALVLMAAGIALTTWAMASNAFFSGLVRIQEDRGQTVVTGGPYRLVRHPGYVGGIVHHLAAPVMLGSWWALIPGGLGALLLVIRTALEDRTLQAELSGYREYAARVRYRLTPGIW